MDRPRQNDHLGVNKTGKSIKKSPLHQPNFPAANANANANANAAAVPRPQGQPQVYNISKNDFRSIVQQLTGSPSRESLPRPPPNSSSPKPQSTRLQRIRPPPLTQISPPAVPPPTMAAPIQHQHHPHGGFVRPPPPQTHFPQQQQQQQQPMMGQGDQLWSNTAESPISGYMRYLQSSLGDAGPNGNQMQPGPEHRQYMPAQEHRPYMPAQSQPQPYMPAQSQRQPYMPAQSQPQTYMPAQSQSQPQAQPQPHMMPGSQPHMNMQGPLPPPGLVPSPVPRNFPSQPQFNGPVPVTPTLPSPRFNQMYGGFPSPRYNGFGPLNSPTSQFAPQSPTGYPNMFGPRSPYPLLSPGVQYPQPLTPNFSFSQLAQSGNHGPGAAGSGPPQPPPSPGLMFPLSPGFFQNPSPRWGNY